MATDLFNNISNDYIQPNLAPCPDAGDSYSFEFLGKKNVGVVNGSQTLSSLNFSDFSQPITSWTQEKKLLQPGEVVYIAGLTKGISYKAETYNSITDVSAFYVTADVSISFYKNFRYVSYNVNASANVLTNMDIENALNLALQTTGANVTVNFDNINTFSFTAGALGYDFSVSAMTIVRDTSTTIVNLTKNAGATMPAFKYPNGAMLGYMLRTTVPASITTESDQWIYIKHVPNGSTNYYEPSTGSGFAQYVKTVDVGLNGASLDPAIMSAGDYLAYITENQLWDKVGSLKAWMGTVDPDNSNIKNLISGFYLFNPQAHPVQIDYILVN